MWPYTLSSPSGEWCIKNLQFEKISILPHRRDWNFLVAGGGGFCKTKKFKEIYKAQLIGISRGVGSLRQNPLFGRGMDIFWNYTIP